MMATTIAAAIGANAKKPPAITVVSSQSPLQTRSPNALCSPDSRPITSAPTPSTKPLYRRAVGDSPYGAQTVSLPRVPHGARPLVTGAFLGRISPAAFQLGWWASRAAAAEIRRQSRHRRGRALSWVGGRGRLRRRPFLRHMRSACDAGRQLRRACDIRMWRASYVSHSRAAAPRSGQGPHLGVAVVAVVDLELGAVGGGVVGVVEAAAGLGVGQAGAVHLPLLGPGAVAVVELHLDAVGGAGVDHVHALAHHLEAAVAGHGEPLRVGAVAVVELDRGVVADAAVVVVGALAGEAGGDRPGLHVGSAGAGVGGRRGGRGPRGVGGGAEHIVKRPT